VNQVVGVSPRVELMVPNSSLTNLTTAVTERVYLYKRGGKWVDVVPPKDSEAFNKGLKSFRSLVMDKLHVSSKWSYDKFIDSYLGRKRTVYAKAADSLKTRGLELRDSYVKWFVKCEKLKAGKTPRVISPRDPRYGIEYGRYMKPGEKMVYKAINKVLGYTGVMKGLNSYQIASCVVDAFSAFVAPCAVGLDVSRFDQSVSKAALEWCHSVWKRMYPGDTYFSQLCKMQLENKCTGRVRDGYISGNVSGSLMSGDFDTSTKGVLLMTAMTWSYCESIGIRCRIIDMGDDVVVVMASTDYPKFSAGILSWYDNFGFLVVPEEPVYTIEKVVFCQTSPVFDGEKWLMVRNPSVGIAKDSISIRDLQSRRQFEGWLGCVAKGGLSLAGGIPIFDRFYNCLLRTSNGRVIHHDSDMDEGLYKIGVNMGRVSHEPTAACRYSFWLAFGIRPDMQVAIEKYYDNLDVSYDRFRISSSGSYIPTSWF